MEAENNKLESEISNYRSNIEIRTSELVRLKSLKAEESRLSAAQPVGGDKPAFQDRFSGGTLQPQIVQSQVPNRETASASIFTQNYGSSTITDKPPKKTNPVADSSMTQPSTKGGRGSVQGPKVKSTSGYCNLI